MRPLRALVTAIAVLTLLAGCGGSTPADTRIQVVATTTVFADLVAHVGGDLVAVTSLVPKGGEVHTFDPTPSDVRHVVEAKLVVRNGLGLDDWLANLVGDAGTAAPVIALGEALPGVTYLEGDEGGAVNPHLWLNVAYARLYVDRIGEALASVDPSNAAAYRSGAAVYGAELDALDLETRDRMAAIPESDRLVISFHDAFPYFAAAYGLEIDGSIVASPGQDPSAAKVEELVTAIRAKGIHLILAEAQFNDALAQAIASETDAVVVTDLYTDSLGDAPLDTYTGVMRSNVDKLVAALALP